MKPTCNQNKWIYLKNMSPQVAACLILGKDPDQYQYQYQIFSSQELTDVSILLGQGRGPKTIFDYAEEAVRYQITINQNLLEQIRTAFANYIPKEQSTFIQNYPYITKFLQLSEPKNSTQKSQITKKMNSMYKLIAVTVKSGFGYDENKKKNQATGAGSGSIKLEADKLGVKLSQDTILSLVEESMKIAFEEE